MELDLHGVKHEDVTRILDQFIWEHMNKSNGIKIITGNSPKMKELVKEVASEYGFVAMESFGNSASMKIDFI